MNASFEEKSVWIQLISITGTLGVYLVIAGLMWSNGVRFLAAFAALYMATVALLVVVLVAGHIVVAVASKPEGRDERDRLIEWRAESNSSWILAVGVFAAITGMVISIDNVWIAHLLILSLYLSEVARFTLQLVYYRRGV